MGVEEVYSHLTLLDTRVQTHTNFLSLMKEARP